MKFQHNDRKQQHSGWEFGVRKGWERTINKVVEENLYVSQINTCIKIYEIIYTLNM